MKDALTDVLLGMAILVVLGAFLWVCIIGIASLRVWLEASGFWRFIPSCRDFFRWLLISLVLILGAASLGHMLREHVDAEAAKLQTQQLER